MNSGSLEISSEGGSGELKNLYMGFRLAPLLFMSRSVVTVKGAVAGRDELLLVFGRGSRITRSRTRRRPRPREGRLGGATVTRRELQ